jgi:glycosyltransferase involved in cell wall biosynthesis
VTQAQQGGEAGAIAAAAAAVTIIIPTRDRPGFLQQAVQDALRQAGVELEVLIVDDGSADADAVRGIEALDRRIRVIRHDSRRGVACARNTGIANAGGAWLAFLDDDDRWAPTKLRTQLDAAAQAQASWVYAAALTIDQDDRILFATAPALLSTVDWMWAANPVPGGCSNVVVRAELVRAVGGFDEQLAILADWDMWIRLAMNGAPAMCHRILMAYRMHPDNMHLREVDSLDVELDHLARKYRTGHDPRRDLFVWWALPWQAKAYRRAGRRGPAARLFLRRWWLTRDPRNLVHVLGSLLGEPIIRMVRRYLSRSKVSRPDWLDRVADPPPRAAPGERAEASTIVGNA